MATIVLFLTLFCGQCFCTDLDEAVEKYALAEQSTVREEKEILLNEALNIYLSHAKVNPSGQLLYNIGTIYTQLGDYGMAIAFFRKAERLIPRDKSLKVNLARAIDVANVHGYQIESPVLDVVCFEWCSPTEKKLIILGCALFSFIFFSLNLWLPFAGLKWLSRFAICGTLLLLVLFSAHYYLVFPRGVIVKATALRVGERSSGEAKLILQPGEMVEILGVGSQKEPVRVRTASYLTGYLPEEAVFVVDP